MGHLNTHSRRPILAGRQDMYVQILILDISHKFIYNKNEVRDMEKLVVEFGFALMCFFFICMLVIGSQFIWGALVGLMITCFGLFFLDE